MNSLQPALWTSSTIRTSGESSPAAISTLVDDHQPNHGHPGDEMNPATGPGPPAGHRMSDPSRLRSRSQASVPVPICNGVIGFGLGVLDRGQRGVRGDAAGEAGTQSWLFAITVWPAALARNARNLCAAAGRRRELQDRRARDVLDGPGIARRDQRQLGVEGAAAPSLRGYGRSSSG